LSAPVSCPTVVCPTVAFCADKIDGTDCGNSKKCSGTVCAPEPTCTRSTDMCTVSGDCCSGFCDPGPSWCLCSEVRGRCYDDGDCCPFLPGLACVAFVCVQT
jgi:hypothetical protein